MLQQLHIFKNIIWLLFSLEKVTTMYVVHMLYRGLLSATYGLQMKHFKQLD